MWELWMLGRVGTRLFDAFFRAARKTGMLGEAEMLGKSDLTLLWGTHKSLFTPANVRCLHGWVGTWQAF